MAVKLMDMENKRRDVLMNAALKEFAEKGFDKASTNVIAKESGISKALMFHYVSSKKELFLFLYEHCTNMIHEEYLAYMNFNEKDIFERLQQSYALQIELLKKHPWIFEFIQMTAAAEAEEINEAMEQKAAKIQTLCQETMFEVVDETKFRDGMNIERCKQIIYWANIGFTNQLLNEMRNTEASDLDYDKVQEELDGFLNELRKSFYK
ncbi:TetR/AcrR family transcriptional regulator [Halobacillus salinarum]|uniref:TetR/AcrR family transcriptional regulator n=1 Tax=Halobacillus salinarum TaxID=2932257 RepID=A0ABY4ELZ5_9BACI|nr:TetR/AcrR family transcriptional regulator [Halobacillus salinarum]UOQ45471.1 TetR/AcrR family transcriptional regulator [Halobacillus salinarum]